MQYECTSSSNRDQHAYFEYGQKIKIALLIVSPVFFLSAEHAGAKNITLYFSSYLFPLKKVVFRFRANTILNYFGGILMFYRRN